MGHAAVQNVANGSAPGRRATDLPLPWLEHPTSWSSGPTMKAAQSLQCAALLARWPRHFSGGLPAALHFEHSDCEICRTNKGTSTLGTTACRFDDGSAVAAAAAGRLPPAAAVAALGSSSAAAALSPGGSAAAAATAAAGDLAEGFDGAGVEFNSFAGLCVLRCGLCDIVYLVQFNVARA